MGARLVAACLLNLPKFAQSNYMEEEEKKKTENPCTFTIKPGDKVSPKTPKYK